MSPGVHRVMFAHALRPPAAGVDPERTSGILSRAAVRPIPGD